MQLEDGRVACIVRRHQRIWTHIRLKGTILSGSSPEERRFEVLDKDLKQVGNITFERYEELKEAVAATPWGRVTMSSQDGYFRNGKRGSMRVSRDGELVAVIAPHLLRLDFDFPGRTVMPFKIRPGRYVLRFEGETGWAGVSVEEGTTGGSGRLRVHNPALEEARALPKEKRPNSVEDPGYTQFTVTVSGILPVDERDIVMTLIMEECLSALDFENLRG